MQDFEVSLKPSRPVKGRLLRAPPIFPTRKSTALSATAENIMATLGPLVGGGLADLFGYDVVFGVSLGVLVAAFALSLVAVKEPRTARLAAL